MPTASVNGADLFYETTGSGPPLVFVHGGLLNHHSWDAVVPLLAEAFEVTTYDLRGHSASTCGDGPITGADHSRDLEALIELLDRGPVFAAGQSLGAMTILRLAGRRGDLFCGVAAHEPPFFNLLAADPQTRGLYEQLRKTLAEVSEQIVAGDHPRAARSLVEGVPAPGAWELYPPALQQTFIDNIPTIDTPMEIDSDLFSLDPAPIVDFQRPVLLTRGSGSPPWFRSTIAKMDAMLPTSRLETIADAGHGPQMTHPAAYAETLSSFLRESAPVTT